MKGGRLGTDAAKIYDRSGSGDVNRSTAARRRERGKRGNIRRRFFRFFKPRNSPRRPGELIRRPISFLTAEFRVDTVRRNAIFPILKGDGVASGPTSNFRLHERSSRSEISRFVTFA